MYKFDEKLIPLILMSKEQDYNSIYNSIAFSVNNWSVIYK